MLKLNLKQTQNLVLTTQLVTAIQLLQLNTIELKQFVETEISENVMLDAIEEKTESLEDIREFAKNYRKDLTYEKPSYDEDSEDRNYEEYVTEKVSLSEYLKYQLIEENVCNKNRGICIEVLDNIGDDGYFKGDLYEIANNHQVDFNLVLTVLKWVQRKFEPKGIGARDLRECLLLQLGPNEYNERTIVKDYLNLLAENKIQEIANEMGISVHNAQIACDNIKKLNPKPGMSIGSGEVVYIKPDAHLRVEDNRLVIEIEEHPYENLKINPYYLSLLENENTDKNTKKYISEKLKKALFIVEAIESRRLTIRKVIYSIAKLQEEYFLGKKDLVPMRLIEVAEDIEMSESTVSRVTRDKYLEFNGRVYELKDFFTGGLGSEEGEVSVNVVKKRIKEIIEGENPKKPLSDQKLTDMLQREGIEISRRTVAKYRDELNIPSTTKRKRF